METVLHHPPPSFVITALSRWEPATSANFIPARSPGGTQALSGTAEKATQIAALSENGAAICVTTGKRKKKP
jgi:hypothetical protein